MGTSTTGDKPKFDLITASRTKKYRIITVVFLIIGLLFLISGLLLQGFVTKAIAPNDLQISELSGLTENYTCDISIDQPFIVRTGTVMDKALSDPITFKFYDGAEQFLEVQDLNHNYTTESHFPGLFYLHVKTSCPEFVKNAQGIDVRPTGKLRISCGSYVKIITFTYVKK